MDVKEQNNGDWGDLLLTSQQVADILHISLRTLQNYRDDGRLNYIRISPRIIRYFPQDVIALIQKSHCSTWRKDNCARLLKVCRVSPELD
ncbi:helix-turn-helix domain-containing protein [Alistipes sp.]|uniref:helix-turn-helix domain-containing protein n=1 Tax=Alistipes sp. TaxID=1872444 RepID=UPI003AB4D8E4